MIYDVIIIGAGPAGMCCSIYLKNANKNILIIEKNAPGGKILKSKKITNYPGFNGESPEELAYSMYKQIENLEIPLVIDSVLSINDGEIKEVQTKNGIYKAKNIVLASGRVEKSLGIENEEKLIGKGISYCVTCDGSLYKNKNVVLVGNSEESKKDLEYLKNLTDNIIYINYNSEPIEDSNINVINNQKIIEIKEATETIKSIVLENQTEIELDCLFISTGYTPNSKIIENLDLVKENGYILVDKNMKTNKAGIYAIGDLIKKDLYQIVTATSDGAIAATNIIKEMR